MADQNIIEIIVQGVQQSVRGILSVSEAQSNLTRIQETLAQRQARTYEQVARAAQQAADQQVQAAERAQAAAQKAAKVNFVEFSGRARDPRGRFVSKEDQLEAARAPFAAPATQLGGLTERIAQGQAQAAQAVQKTTQTIQQQAAALRAVATAAQTYAAAQDASTKAGQRLAAQALAVAATANKQADALLGAAHGSNQAGARGITYLSVLSAIHAASFLATNQTFSMIGSFATLTAAFGKMGLAASVGGAALGALLGVFGTIGAAAQQIQQFALDAAKGLVAFGAAATAGAVAAGAAAVKTAGDVEQQLASVRAFGGASAEQLAQVSQQAIEFSERFGVAAKDVVEATSLFSRAGGTVKEAIDGATEAIIRLQVASQGELTAAQSAIALSAAMRQFSLDGSQAVKVADSLTAAAQSSALSFTGVQQAFIQAAPGAAGLGITLDDLTASTALLGDQLIKGTTTGTAFKQFVLDVVNPTKQAQGELAKYGISLRDANGNALPFLDALVELNKGLGDNAIAASGVSKEQRATALAVAFGSRAFLAANILTREGTTALEQYREKIAQVSTANIVDILLLPLNKQLERLQIVVQNTGQAFGASLLPQARAAVVGVISALQGLRPVVEALGQTVSVTLANQGFGVLQDKIRELTGNDQAAAFFNGLLSVVGNVRDVLTSQIVPAIQNFGQTVLQTFSQISGAGTVASTFDSINVAIQRVGITAAVIIGNLASLTREFILNIGVGGQLRQTLSTIATTIATNLISAFQTAVVVIGAAAATMPLFAQAALLSAKFVVALANTINGLRLAFAKLEPVIQRHVLTSSALAAASRGNIVLAKEYMDQIDKVNTSQGALEASIVAESQALNTIVSSAEALIPALQGIGAAHDQAAAAAKVQIDAVGTLNKSIDQITNELIAASGQDVDLLTEADVARFRDQAETVRGEARRLSGSVVNSFVDAAQQLPNPLANIVEEVERIIRALEASTQGTRPGVPGALSDEQLKAAAKRIEEAGRDVNRRLANLGEDAATRVAQNIDRALERLDDIRQNALDRVDEINRQAQDRITESRRTTAERREDRQEVDDFKQIQEDKFQEFQRGLDRQEAALQRSLDDTRTKRQQDNDDFLSIVDQQVQDVEKGEQRKLDAVQRGFDLAQRARETAFDRAQNVEATAFSRQQEAAAEARRFSLDLAKAKPEDRAKLTAQHQESLQDTKFKQGQEDELTKFRIKQEEAKRKFSETLETQAISFRQGMEDRLAQVRKANERAVLQLRRSLEAAEVGTRRSEEDETTRRRLANEEIVTARRREDTLKLQALQDAIEDKRRGQEETRILGSAFNEAQKVIANAEKQAGEVVDKLFLDLKQQADDVDKQLRNIIDTLIDLQDQVPPELLGKFLAELTAAQSKVQAIKSDLAEKQGAAQLQVSQQKAVNQAELELKLASLIPAAGRTPPQAGATPTPQGIIQLQTLQVANVTLPPGFSSAVAGAVRLGIQQAVDQGLLPSDIGVNLTPVVNPLEAIRQLLGR